MIGFMGIGQTELILLGILCLVPLAAIVVVAIAISVSRRRTTNENLEPCPDCRRLVSKQAAACPQCGRPLR